MSGITVDDITGSVAYREISGQNRQSEPIAFSLRRLAHSCGALTPANRPAAKRSCRALGSSSVALTEVQAPVDLNAWLSRHAS